MVPGHVLFPRCRICHERGVKLKKSYAKDAPLVRRLHGKILVPTMVEPYIDPDGNDGYCFCDVEVDDTGQDITDDTVRAGLISQVEAAHNKRTGIQIFGVMCSATAEDMWGLAAVRSWVLAGNSTTFYFSNGNTLILTKDNIDAFEAVWVPFRASFFGTDEEGE